LARLIDAGSKTNAALVGLDKFTTTTNNMVESTNRLDIGYHYSAVNPNTVVTIFKTVDAIEPNAGAGITGQNGVFTVFRTGPTTNDLTVYYSIGGTAIPGTNYNPALPGSVIIPATSAVNTIDVSPIDDGVIDPPLTVIATLIQTNTYLVGSPDRATLNITNSDQTLFTTVVSNLRVPIGLDYHSPSNALIVSWNWPEGQPVNFLQVTVNGTNSTTNAWTTLSNMGNEIKLATVKTTANGFTVGDMYYNTSVGGPDRLAVGKHFEF
ncbi:MAG: hypothetical protein DME19_14835, partial [Verrucomicrobia bacterium]